MREFYELINEYPWTSFLLALFVYELLVVILNSWRK